MSLDIYIPSQQVAIEYDGGVFHRDSKRDIKKDRWLLEKMPGVTLIRIREPECGNYSSVHEKVLNYHLADQKTETFVRCIEQIFQEIFQRRLQIDLDKDNTEILRLMDRTEVEKSLGELFPALCEEWDTEKNNGLTPFQFRAASHEQVHWICKKEHSRKASIASRSHGGNNCPFCGSRKINTDNNLAIKFPTVIQGWHPTKNKKKPNEYFPASHFSVWWLCSHCQHEWKSRIYNGH
ncbi:zinc-ribbon domain-containing protein [Bacillus pumilus]|uniref:zinc-ribbon domain-containing protein n=1 Tax=Bacillus pumilus TaxID=1408 RepID=UPI002E1A9B17|nr:zinc-ribbon domain-containing protein [Bacillus pumilus]